MDLSNKVTDNYLEGIAYSKKTNMFEYLNLYQPSSFFLNKIQEKKTLYHATTITRKNMTSLLEYFQKNKYAICVIENKLSEFG